MKWGRFWRSRARPTSTSRVVSRSECVCAERLASKLEQNFTHQPHNATLSPLPRFSENTVHTSALTALSQDSRASATRVLLSAWCLAVFWFRKLFWLVCVRGVGAVCAPFQHVRYASDATSPTWTASTCNAAGARRSSRVDHEWSRLRALCASQAPPSHRVRGGWP